MKKRVAIYARVSTDEQAEKGYSLPHQFSECRKYAERQGLTVVQEISDDYSGATLERPGFSSLRQIIDAQQVDAVIVYTADRLSRNIVDFLVLREQWEKAQIELHFADRGKSQNNFEGLLTDGIFALLAHGERLKIIERTTDGRHNKAKANRIVMSGIPPYGYKKLGIGRDAEYVIDEFEAEVVRKIFGWYVNGSEEYGHLTLHGISNLLDRMGISPPSKRTKIAPFWHPATLGAILGNSIYAGITYYGKLKSVNGKRTPRPRDEWVQIEVPQLALVSIEMYQEAQNRAKRNQELASRNRKKPYLLSGHIRCGACGNVMFGYRKKPAKISPRSFYRCSAASHKGGRCPGLKKQVSMPKVDSAVWNWIASLLTDENNLNEGIRATIEKRQSEEAPKREKLRTVESLISSAETKIYRLVDELSQYDGEAVRNAIREKINAIDNERGLLTEEREQLAKELERIDVPPDFERQIRRTAELIRRNLPDTSLENKRRIMEALEVKVKYSYEEARGDILEVSCTIPGTDGQIVFDTSPRSLRLPCRCSIANPVTSL